MPSRRHPRDYVMITSCAAHDESAYENFLDPLIVQRPLTNISIMKPRRIYVVNKVKKQGRPSVVIIIIGSLYASKSVQSQQCFDPQYRARCECRRDLEQHCVRGSRIRCQGVHVSKHEAKFPLLNDQESRHLQQVTLNRANFEYCILNTPRNAKS